jgi:hypothetical protein
MLLRKVPGSKRAEMTKEKTEVRNEEFHDFLTSPKITFELKNRIR